MQKNIPVLFVQERTLAETYEKALILLYDKGTRLQTQYDKPGSPLSIDATMNLTILEPMSDPMIHKAFPGGIDDLREYAMEICGAKDHWVKNINDPNDTRWEYTYHGRLEAYGAWRELQNGISREAGFFKINQIRKSDRKAFFAAVHPPGADDHLDAEPGFRLLRPPLPPVACGTASWKTTRARNGSTATSGSARTMHGERIS